MMGDAEEDAVCPTEEVGRWREVVGGELVLGNNNISFCRQVVKVGIRLFFQISLFIIREDGLGW